MVDTFTDEDADLGKYFRVQRYRRNKKGSAALSIYVTIAMGFYCLSLWRSFAKAVIPELMFGVFAFIPPVAPLYFFAFLVSDPMELRDGMCITGKVLTNLFTLLDTGHRVHTCYNAENYVDAVVFLLSLPIQLSFVVPEHWPGAKLMRPFVLRPVAEVEAERKDLIIKWKSSVPRV